MHFPKLLTVAAGFVLPLVPIEAKAQSDGPYKDERTGEVCTEAKYNPYSAIENKGLRPGQKAKYTSDTSAFRGPLFEGKQNPAQVKCHVERVVYDLIDAYRHRVVYELVARPSANGLRPVIIAYRKAGRTNSTIAFYSPDDAQDIFANSKFDLLWRGKPDAECYITKGEGKCRLDILKGEIASHFTINKDGIDNYLAFYERRRPFSASQVKPDDVPRLRVGNIKAELSENCSRYSKQALACIHDPAQQQMLIAAIMDGKDYHYKSPSFDEARYAAPHALPTFIVLRQLMMGMANSYQGR